MTDLSKRRKKEYYETLKSDDYDNLKETFQKTFEVFLKGNYNQVDEEYGESLLCSIHNSFESGHNCVACNLDRNNRRIESFLVQYKSFVDLDLTLTMFIMLLYLQVEAIDEYFSIIKIQDSYRLKHFKVFQEIKRWANFLKHPKSFMLVHHPWYSFQGMKNMDPETKKLTLKTYSKEELTLDTVFIEEFYSGGKKNTILYNKLKNKEGLYVVFPNPIDLITRFIKAQEKFTEVIANNEIVREILNNKATIREHLVKED